MTTKKPLLLTDVVLRDAHQSLFATRMRIDDMLPVAEKLDKIGYYSLETWGGATFDACIRFLGEDPWERLRRLKQVMPNTPFQMLFRAQNILGYRHYGDDVVHAFVERAAKNGMDVFRIFDAMNDLRNFKTAVKATLEVDKHAQGALSYTVSPVHNKDYWLSMAQRLQDMGCTSICVKDMAGLLKPYVAEELISGLKEVCEIPIAMHCHATTGLSTATIVKAAEAGVDMVDTSISSMSMTYGHSSTEAVAAIMQGTGRDTNLDITELEEIAAYFREVRKKYSKFEGALKGIDARILIAQVPGGMLTNMEGQLKDQGAEDKLDEVLKEIPKVREDLGYIPLVTPTSQIVGTQAVLNVLAGERYKSIAKETASILKGEYGATPAPMNGELQQRVLEGAQAISCRPADLIDNEMDKLTTEFDHLVAEHGIAASENKIDDVLTYALFPQVGLKFLRNRHNPEAFEPIPGNESTKESSTAASTIPVTAADAHPENYTVEVNGQTYKVKVSAEGAVEQVAPTPSKITTTAVNGSTLNAPLSGMITQIVVEDGAAVIEGDVLIILEAMKMETEVRATFAGTVNAVYVKQGDSVHVGDTLMVIS